MDDLLNTDACTLPTVDRPLRLAEFDALFEQSVTAVERRQNRTRLTLRGSPGLRAHVLDLTRRESACCSFFCFDLIGDDHGLVLDIGVPWNRRDILDAMSLRAEALSS